MIRHRWYTAAGRGITPVLPLLAGLNIAGATAAELQQPPKCSALPGASPGPAVCSVSTPSDLHGGRELRIQLDARTAPVHVGGYEVTAETYNGTYLPPVLELAPGDRLAVQLSDDLAPDEPAMGDSTGPKVPDPTNLHTHGLIVPPDPDHGDNAFVLLHGNGDRHGYAITIPTDLPANLLRGDPSVGGGRRAHPSGLFWYHPHAHMYAAKQVGGGMSGLLAIGEEKANLVSDSDANTTALRGATDVRYLMLRDIQLKTSAEPGQATGTAAAEWRERDPVTDLCDRDQDPGKPESRSELPGRLGFCKASRHQGDDPTHWLFTVNGQRYPTITVDGGRNALLRIANLNATMPYQLELVPKADWRRGDVDSHLLPLTIVSVDGVPPGGQDVAADPGQVPVKKAGDVSKLLLLSAARSEVLLRNDGATAEQTRTYVLLNRHLNTGADYWPTVALAEVVLRGHPARPGPQAPAYLARLAAGAPESAASDGPPAVTAFAPHAQDSRGCIRDIRRADREHRRLVLATNGVDSNEKLRIDSSIVRPRPGAQGAVDYSDVQQDDTTVIYGHPFEDYLDGQQNVVWRADDGFHPKHICVDQSEGAGHGNLAGSNAHGQVWEIVNQTDELHNFHLHQSKFHLSTPADLDRVGITTGDGDPAVVLDSATDAGQAAFDLFGDAAAAPDSWHDTLPVPPHGRIFITVNLNAPQQRGQFVLHCHFLEHEDKGMMAPIEVFENLGRNSEVAASAPADQPAPADGSTTEGAQHH